MAPKLGEMLLKAKLITQEQLQQALEHQKSDGGKLGANLVELGFIKDEQITQLLSQQFGVPAVNLAQFKEIDAQVIKLIPAEVAQKYQVMPLTRTGATLTIAMVDPTNVFAMDDIKFMTGYNVEPVVASETAILEAIDTHYGASAEIEQKDKFEDLVSAALTDDVGADLEMVEEEEDLGEEALAAASEDAPVVKLVNLFLTDALKRGASDIHVEPYEKEFRIRFRIDGVLYEIMKPPLKLRDAVISRLKIMSKLDISEKRLPQDGRIKLKMKFGSKTKELDFRVSTIPTIHGEKVVLRLLDKDNLMFDMTKLGFEPESLTKFEAAILKPWGMVLVTGPTGSGKTNTLYSSMARVNTPQTNIMTAEDPVEFQIPGINQIQMKESIGLNFSAALRSFLRQDPNIILVGEIRDFETAEIAVKAALTGHLVLSTLHTNDAPSTINRLMNMGIEPFLVATSVHLICAQRLVRRICAECKEEMEVPVQTLVDIGYTPEEAKSFKPARGRGCGVCTNTGYKGRVGLYEVLEVSDDIRELVLSGASSLEIKQKAQEQGLVTLRRSGLTKIARGVTSIDEVVRETVL